MEDWIKSLQEFPWEDIPAEDRIRSVAPPTMTKYKTPEDKRQAVNRSANKYYYRNRERILLAAKIDPKDWKVRTYGPILNARRSYRLTYKDGHTKIVVGLKEWCKENNISRGNLHQVRQGKRKSCGGIVAVEELTATP